MAETETRPEAKDEAMPDVRPETHDAPGLTPFERMTELTRRIINVPKAEADRKRPKKKRRH